MEGVRWRLGMKAPSTRKRTVLMVVLGAVSLLVAHAMLKSDAVPKVTTSSLNATVYKSPPKLQPCLWRDSKIVSLVSSCFSDELWAVREAQTGRDKSGLGPHKVQHKLVSVFSNSYGLKVQVQLAYSTVAAKVSLAWFSQKIESSRKATLQSSQIRSLKCWCAVSCTATYAFFVDKQTYPVLCHFFRKEMLFPWEPGTAGAGTRMCKTSTHLHLEMWN